MKSNWIQHRFVACALLSASSLFASNSAQAVTFSPASSSVTINNTQGWAEGALAVHPSNPQIMTASGISNGEVTTVQEPDPSGPPGTTYPHRRDAYYSTDGGMTWATAASVVGEGYTDDPDVDFTADGAAYRVGYGSNPGRYPNAGSGIFVYKSTDNGVNYTQVTALALSNKDGSYPLKDTAGKDIVWRDGPHLFIDRGVTPNIIYVYFAANGGMGFSTSVDAGQTYTTTIIPYGGQMTAGPDGSVYLYNGSLLKMPRGGSTFTQYASAFPIYGNYYGWGNFPTSSGGFVKVAKDPLSATNNIYIAYGSDALDGGDVFFRRLVEGGSVWSEPIKINDDAPISTCGGATAQYQVGMDVAPNGRIDVFWYDRRNDPQKTNCDPLSTAYDLGNNLKSYHYADVYYAYSLDGGLTFSPNVRVSTSQGLTSGDYSRPLSVSDGAFPWIAQRTVSSSGGVLTIAPYAAALTRKVIPDAVPVLSNGADLVMVAPISGASAAATGTSITVSDTVRNSGTGKTGASNVGYYLSTDNLITTADTLIGSRSLASLRAGNSSTGSVSAMIPSWLAAGNYYLGAIADYNGVVPESSEANNALVSSSVIPITISAGPDLIMTSTLTGPLSAATGTNILVNSTVKNIGIGSSNEFRVCYYLSTDNTITTNDIYLGARVTGLAANASDASGAWVTIPSWNVIPAAGNYYLGAIADCGSQISERADYSSRIPESNEGNNTLFSSSTIAITLGPDLQMVSPVSGPSTAVAGSSIAVSNTVKNTGVGAAGYFYVSYYLSTDNVITAGDVLIGDRILDKLAVADSSAATSNVTIPVGIAAGTYYLGAIADAYQWVPELNESNNALLGNTITIGQPLAANAGLAQSVNAGALVTLAGSATGGSSPLSYVWTQTSGPAVTLTNANTATATFAAPQVSADTVLNFTLAVTDSLGVTASASTAVTVKRVNQLPIANPGPEVSVNEGKLATLVGSATDPDGTIVKYAWAVTDNGGVAPVTLMGADTATVSFTAPYISWNAMLDLTLTVTDNDGETHSATTYVYLRNVNQAPTANPGPEVSVNEGKLATLVGSATDPDGTIVKYAWAVTDNGGVAPVTLMGADTATVSFTAPYISSNTMLDLTLTVTDNYGETHSATTYVYLRNVNQAPTANPGPEVSVNEGNVATLTGSGTDPDGTIVKYAWAVTDGGGVAPVTLVGADTATVSFTAPYVSSNAMLDLTLTVTDNYGETHSATTYVYIRNVNQAPIANPGPSQNVNEGTVATLSGVNSSDPDGSIVAYEWTQVVYSGDPVVSLSGANTAMATFAAPLVSAASVMLEFQLKVTDNDGATATALTWVYVKNVNQLPTANAGAAQTVNEGALVTLTGSGTDPDGTIASYAWTQTGGPAVTLSSATVASPTFTAPQVSADTVLTFSLTVMDNDGASSAPATTTVTVKNLGPDLIVSALTASVISGTKPLSVKDQITNQGNTAVGAFSVAYYLSTDTVFNAATDILTACTKSVTGLAANTSNPVTGTAESKCKFPAAATIGALYYVFAVADSGNTVVESDENNNTRVSTTQVKAQ